MLRLVVLLAALLLAQAFWELPKGHEDMHHSPKPKAHPSQAKDLHEAHKADELAKQIKDLEFHLARDEKQRGEQTPMDVNIGGKSYTWVHDTLPGEPGKGHLCLGYHGQCEDGSGHVKTTDWAKKEEL